MKRLLLLIGLISLVSCYRAVPGLISSHKLIPGLQSHVLTPKPKPYPIDEVMALSKRLISPCSSDIYVLINQPDLELQDFENYENWPFLRRYLSLSSTIVSFPFASDTIDLNHLEKYIIKTCHAETIEVNHESEDEVPHYIDSRTRIIKINFSGLGPELDEQQRSELLKSHDELIRKILRKLPSPHYSIILTSDNVKNYHPIPERVFESLPKKGEVFPDIVMDESRKVEFERNNNVENVPPQWSEPNHNKYGYSSKNIEVKLLDRDLLLENEKLIITMIVMAVSLLLFKVMGTVKKWVS